jgi:hypothetical protein
MGRVSCARLLNALSIGEKDMMQEKKDMIQGKKDMMQEKSPDTTTEETFEIEGLTGVEQNVRKLKYLADQNMYPSIVVRVIQSTSSSTFALVNVDEEVGNNL